MLSSKLEVLVELNQKDDSVINKTIQDLKTQNGIQDVQFKNGAFMVETTLPSSIIIDMVTKSTGKRSVLQGFGDTQSAVAMVSNQQCCPSKVMGIIRFQQSTEGPLIVDGTVDGLKPGVHGLNVHTSGDLSQGCNSIGPIYNTSNTKKMENRQLDGNLGNITAENNGRATFRIIDDVLKVYDIIGRSIAVTETQQNNAGKESWISVACGIIARSAGVFENSKRICACDGVVVWDERDRPLAGHGRRQGGCCRNRDVKCGCNR